MKQVIYVDVLFALNTLIGFFIIKSAACICREKPNTVRVLIGSFMSGVYSLCIFLPQLHIALTLFARLLFIIAVSLAVFGFQSFRRLLRCFGAVLGVTFLLAGVLVGVSLLFAPSGLLIRNGSVYFDVSFLSLVLCCAALYAVLWLLGRFVFRRSRENVQADVVLKFGSGTVELKGIIDTGNLLCDSFTGKPVSVIGQRAALELLPSEYAAAAVDPANAALPFGMHLIVSDTVGGTALMCAFEADEMFVSTQQSETLIKKAAVAVSTREDFGKDCSVLINSQISNSLTGGRYDDKKNTMPHNRIASAAQKQRNSLHKRSGNSACTADSTAGKGSDAKN